MGGRYRAPDGGRDRAGTLPHPTFRFYFEQNLLYLGEYARAIAFARPGRPTAGRCRCWPGSWARSSMWRSRRTRHSCRVSEGSPGGSVPMLPTTYAYTRHLLDATSRGGLAVALAALLPCQWSYGEIGRHLARSLPADPGLPGLGLLFAGDGYDELVVASTELLDCLCTAGDQPRTSDAFDRSVRYEIAFWEMAYTRGASDRA